LMDVRNVPLEIEGKINSRIPNSLGLNNIFFKINRIQLNYLTNCKQ